jgi:anthranilate synthase component 2
MVAAGARVLLLDNYDSFSWNLVQGLRQLGAGVEVRRNDEVTVAQVFERPPTHLVVSPGPGRPEDAGISMDLIAAALGVLPVLGVCLGHQALASVLGGRVEAAAHLFHGKSSEIHHDGRTIFAGLASPFEAGRYHSLIVSREGLPSALEVSAWTETGEVMGLRHVGVRAEGVQFHPESVLTPDGLQILTNWLAL